MLGSERVLGIKVRRKVLEMPKRVSNRVAERF